MRKGQTFTQCSYKRLSLLPKFEWVMENPVIKAQLVLILGQLLILILGKLLILNMGLINKVDMVCLSPVGYGV